MGAIDVKPRTVIIVYVATASADGRPCGVPLSNSIAIAVVQRKDKKAEGN
jgi:hypothetical protein